MLRGCNFIMLCLKVNAKTIQASVYIIKECTNITFQNTEVLVLELLSLWRDITEECASTWNQIKALPVQVDRY